jgi:hypothetical protein
MISGDPDRAAILARRHGFILLALTGAGLPFTACSSPQICLSIREPDEPDNFDALITTVCPAELGPAVSLLSGTQMRLPDGMSPDETVELAPGFVRLSAPVESVGCIDGMPGGMINYFALTVVDDDPRKPMPVLRDELLSSFGYVGPSVSDEVIDEVARSYEVVLDIPAPPAGEENPLEDPSASGTLAEPARAFLRIIAKEGRLYVVIYEVHPAAWNALQASLRASASSISFLTP